MAQDSENNWMSFADIMTTLMIIFMFIAISYISEINDRQKERDRIFEEFKATKEELFNELDSVFKADFEKWEVILDKDLSIKFTNPDVLFRSGRKEIRPYFAAILNNFFPRYFQVLLQEKYEDKISEIRIEGHTDTVPAPKFDSDPYIGNILLSQQRSAEVLKYFRNMEYYKTLSSNAERNLQFWLTANGLSFGRTVDNNNLLTIISGEAANNEFSRRVEFRIITTSEKLVERVIKEMGSE